MAAKVLSLLWEKVDWFIGLISNNSGTTVQFSGGVDVVSDPAGGDGVGNRDYNDARYATAAQGALADTATQPGDLGTAAASATTDFVPTDGSVTSITFSNGAKLEVSGTTLVITDAP
jgi:hypothetical protein